jgi:hypothetical protein
MDESARRVVTVRCIVNIEGRTHRHFFCACRIELGRLQTRSIAGAESARLRASLTTVLASSKIGSRRRSMTRSRSPNRTVRSRIRGHVSDGVIVKARSKCHVDPTLPRYLAKVPCHAPPSGAPRVRRLNEAAGPLRLAGAQKRRASGEPVLLGRGYPETVTLP